MKNRHYVTKSRIYSKVPNKIYRMGLSVQELSVFLCLTSFDEEENPSIETIARQVNLSNPTVIKSLKNLQESNLIIKYEQGGIHRVSKYEFTRTNKWKKKAK